jgi:hypothetical protein
MTNFWVKRTKILVFWLKKCSLPVKNKIIYNFMIFVAAKIGRTKKYFLLIFWCCCWIRDPGSGIWVPESGMYIKSWSGFRDKCGVNIPDPQHWFQFIFLVNFPRRNIHYFSWNWYKRSDLCVQGELHSPVLPWLLLWAEVQVAPAPGVRSQQRVCRDIHGLVPLPLLLCLQVQKWHILAYLPKNPLYSLNQ